MICGYYDLCFFGKDVKETFYLCVAGEPVKGYVHILKTYSVLWSNYIFNYKRN